MISRRHAIGLAASAALAPGFVARTLAQSVPAWPTRIVRLVVPFAPGGSTDAMARIIANRLSEIWGQQMVVENRGGGGSNIGHEAVARCRPRRLFRPDRLAATRGQSLSVPRAQL